MFKFLFGDKTTPAQVKKETQREIVLRAQKELNAVLSTLSPKARITIYPEEGTLTIELPEQMPDEAKALPAPPPTPAPTAAQKPAEPAKDAKPADAPAPADTASTPRQP
ncbi:MAG: hypothetical protein EA339_12675 [Rhodobacteraceae bacterium]|nr:MAG: hypothetical protein EA339_12675 [Paracoccaceae bacterium]